MAGYKIMQLTHEQKVKKARKMITSFEVKKHIPLFSSTQWNERANAKRLKEQNKFTHGKRQAN
jgi:hypothetical protein